jgi:hypothetical protein
MFFVVSIGVKHAFISPTLPLCVSAHLSYRIPYILQTVTGVCCKLKEKQNNLLHLWHTVGFVIAEVLNL